MILCLNMIIFLILFIAELFFGVLIFDFFDPENKFHTTEKLVAGAFVGFLLSNFLMLAYATFFHSLFFAILFFILIFFAVNLLRFKKAIKLFSELNIFFRRKWISRKNIWLFFLLIILVIYCLYIPTILFYGKGHSLLSPLTGWGDTAFHINLIERFSVADPFYLVHPFMAGEKIVYPLTIDFISGIFLKTGADFLYAFYLPLILCGLSAILLLFFVSLRVLKSKSFAILAIVFIFWGSGLSFITLFKDMQTSYDQNGIDGVSKLIEKPPYEYTYIRLLPGVSHTNINLRDNMRWMVPIVGFFSHQRSFSLGLAIFSLMLLGIYHYGKSKNFWRYGIIAGLLLFSHVHSFLALFLLCAVLFWFFLPNWKNWILFGFLTGLIALPQLLYYRSGSAVVNKLFEPWFGWMACDSHNNSWFFCDPGANVNENVLFFWIKNFGVVFIGWIFALMFVLLFYFFPLIRKRFSENFRTDFIFASSGIFIFTNFLAFQPWIFEYNCNDKTMFYWWLTAIIFCLMPILKIIWQKGRFGKSIVVLLVIIGTCIGFFDFATKFLWVNTKNAAGYSDGLKENIELANWIKNNTMPNDLFLTHLWIDSVPLFLAGRPTYLGYEGWLLGMGYSVTENKQKASEILQGNTKLACLENIKYIMLDGGLRRYFPEIDENTILAKTQTVFVQENPYETIKILKIICDK